MQDNLIERLRSGYIGTTSTPKWMNEAADKIERLRSINHAYTASHLCHEAAAEIERLKGLLDAAAVELERRGDIAAEREACARVAETLMWPDNVVAAAIRARK